MASLGFTYYNTRPVVSRLTIQELIDNLSGVQKGAILDGFVKKILPKTLAYDVSGLSREVVVRLYRAIDEIEEVSRHLMRGEVIITPAVIDPVTGEVTIPAVYNTLPAKAGALLSAVQGVFSEDFNAIQVTAILTKMVEYSKYDGSGDWAFYKNNVTL